MNRPERIVRITVVGWVQGVGYRAWTQRQAEALGVSGWVRNRVNGDVEAIFAGSIDSVEALCAACWRGPSHARVEKVHISEADAAALAELGAARGFQLAGTI